jgi:gliding motility-associated-like protein
VITADFCADTYEADITIYPAPVASFSATDVCEGDETTFVDESTVTSGQISIHSWDFADAQGTSTASDPTYTYATSGTYAVELEVTTTNGCSTSTFQNVTVNPLPDVIALSTDILCAGQTNGTARASAVGGTGPYDYSWNDIFQSTTDSIGDLAAGSYTITVTDALNCTADTTVIVDVPLPITLNMVAGNDTCSLGNGAVQAQVLGGTAPFEYIWSAISDSASIYDEAFTPSGWNTNLSPGDYSVTVIDSGGCIATGEATVGLIPKPQADFLSRSKPEEFSDPSVQFDNESLGAVSYEWHLGDGIISYEENPVHLYDTSGAFLVMLIAYNEAEYGCADTTFGYVDVEPFFTFYVPNAFTPDGDGDNDTWGPKGLNFEYESYNVQVFDRWGKRIWQTDNPFKWWDGTDQKTLKDVKQGMYAYQFLVKEFNTFEPKKITGTVMLYRHN